MKLGLRHGCVVVGMALAMTGVATAQEAPAPLDPEPTDMPDGELPPPPPAPAKAVLKAPATPPSAPILPPSAPALHQPARNVPDRFSVGYGFTMMSLGVLLGVGGIASAGADAESQQCGLSGCFDVPNHTAEHKAGGLMGAGLGLAVSGVTAVALGWDGYSVPVGMHRNDAAVSAGMMLTSMGSATLGSGMGMLIADGSRGDVFRIETIVPLMAVGGLSSAIGIPVWLTSLDDLEHDGAELPEGATSREPNDRSTAVGITGIVMGGLGLVGAGASVGGGLALGGMGGAFIAIIGAGVGGGLAIVSVPLMVMGFKDAPVGYEVRSATAMASGVALLSLGTPALITGGALAGEVPGHDGEPDFSTAFLIPGLIGVSAGLPLTVWGSWLVPEHEPERWAPEITVGPGGGELTMRF